LRAAFQQKGKMTATSKTALRLAAVIATASWTLDAQPKGAPEPFGFHRGMTREQIIRLVGAGEVKASKGHPQDELRVLTAPKPHPAFEQYDLVISPSEGLLKIVAVGKDIATNGYGEEIRAEFGELSDAVARTYGTPQIADYLKEGSIWNEPREWMTGLLKKERELFALWSPSENRIGEPYVEPGNRVSIVLESAALSETKGYSTLVYEFDGWSAYVLSKKAIENKVF